MTERTDDMVENNIQELEDKYKEKSWIQRWKTIVFGIKKEKQTRPYKEAIIELIHETAKAIAFVVCVFAIIILLAIRSERRIPNPVNVPVEIIEIKDEPIVLDPPDPPEIVNPDIDSPNNDINLPGIEDLQIEQPIDDSKTVSPKPADITAVSTTKSPIKMPGVRGGPPGMKGGSFGYGGGSALATDLVGYMIDLKQGDHSNLSFRHAVKELIDANWSKEALSHYYIATNKLYLNYLFVEKQPAENGPAAFNCQDQVQPRKWVAHYEGRLNPSHSGEYRFIGHFDDLLIVMVDGKPVLDAYWQNRETYRGGGRSEITGWKPDEKGELFDKHQSFSGQPLVHGDWIYLEENCNKKIDIVLGEEPGGVVGGILLLEEKNKKYEKTPSGRDILPLFAMSKLEEFEAASVTNSMTKMNFQVDVYPINLPAMNYKKEPSSNKKPSKDVKVEIKRK